MSEQLRYHTDQESVKLVIDNVTNKVMGVVAGKEGSEEKITRAGEAMLRALNSFVEGKLGMAPKIDLFTSEGRLEALAMLDSFQTILESIPAFLEEKGFFRSGDEPRLKTYLEDELIPAKLNQVAKFRAMVDRMETKSRANKKQERYPRGLVRLAKGAVTVITLALFLTGNKDANAAAPTKEQTGNTPDTTVTQVPAEQDSTQELISQKLDEISFSVATYLDNLQSYFETHFPEELKIEGQVSSGPSDDVEVTATPSVPTNTPEKSEGNPNPAEYVMTGMEGFAVTTERTEAVFKYVSETKNTPLAALNEKGSFFGISSPEELTKIADLLDPNKGALHTKIMEWGTYASRFGDAATTRVYFFPGKNAQETRVAFSATLTKDWSNEGGEKYAAGSTVFLNDESKHLMVQPRDLGRNLTEKEDLDFHVVKFSKLVANADAKAQLVADFEKHQTALPSDESLVIVELFTDANGVIQLSKIVDAQGKFLMEFDVTASSFSVVKPIGTQVPEDITLIVNIKKEDSKESFAIPKEQLPEGFTDGVEVIVDGRSVQFMTNIKGLDIVSADPQRMKEVMAQLGISVQGDIVVEFMDLNPNITDIAVIAKKDKVEMVPNTVNLRGQTLYMFASPYIDQGDNKTHIRVYVSKVVFDKFSYEIPYQGKKIVAYENDLNYAWLGVFNSFQTVKSGGNVLEYAAKNGVLVPGIIDFSISK